MNSSALATDTVIHTDRPEWCHHSDTKAIAEFQILDEIESIGIPGIADIRKESRLNPFGHWEAILNTGRKHTVSFELIILVTS